MIRLRITATGVALAVLLFTACRDAPTLPLSPADSVLAPSLSVDSVDEAPIPADIRNAYTLVSFYDGTYAGEPMMEITARMEYIGNKALMITRYAISGAVNKQNTVTNDHDGFWNPALWKHWSAYYAVPTGSIKCGMHMEADTDHAAWWDIWVRLGPNPRGTKVWKFTSDEFETPPCDHGPHPDDSTNSGGGGSSGGWITIETCHYWAHYVNGVLVDIELRYCTYDQIPVADE